MDNGDAFTWEKLPSITTLFHSGSPNLKQKGKLGRRRQRVQAVRGDRDEAEERYARETYDSELKRQSPPLFWWPFSCHAAVHTKRHTHSGVYGGRTV